MSEIRTCYAFAKISLTAQRMIFALEAPKEALQVAKQKPDLTKDARDRLEKITEQIKKIEELINSINIIRGEKTLQIPLAKAEFEKMLKNSESIFNRKEFKEFKDALLTLIEKFEDLKDKVLKAEGTKDTLKKSFDDAITAINTALGDVEEKAKGVVGTTFNPQDPLAPGDLSLTKLSAIDPFRAATETEKIIYGKKIPDGEKDTGLQEKPDNGLLKQALTRELPTLMREKLPPAMAAQKLVENIFTEHSQETAVDPLQIFGGSNTLALVEFFSQPNHPQHFMVDDGKGGTEVTVQVRSNGGEPKALEITWSDQVSGTAKDIAPHKVVVVLPGSFLTYGGFNLDQKKLSEMKMEPLRAKEAQNKPGGSLDENLKKFAELPAGSKMLVTTADGAAVGIKMTSDKDHGGLQKYSVQMLLDAAQIAQFRSPGVDNVSPKGKAELAKAQEEARKNAIADAAWGTDVQGTGIGKKDNIAKSDIVNADAKAKMGRKELMLPSQNKDFNLTLPEIIGYDALSNHLEQLKKNPFTVELIPVAMSGFVLERNAYTEGMLGNIRHLASDITGYAALGKMEDVKKTLDKLADNIGLIGVSDKVREILGIGKDNAGFGIKFNIVRKPDGHLSIRCAIGEQVFESRVFKSVGDIKPAQAEVPVSAEKGKTVEISKPEKSGLLPERERLLNTLSDEACLEEIKTTVANIDKQDAIARKESLLWLAALIHRLGPNKEVRKILGVKDNGESEEGSKFKLTNMKNNGARIALGYESDEATVFEEGEIAKANAFWADKQDKISPIENKESKNPLTRMTKLVNEIKEGKHSEDINKALSDLAALIKQVGPTLEMRRILEIKDNGESKEGSKFRLTNMNNNGEEIALFYGDTSAVIFAKGEIDAANAFFAKRLSE